jgi:hypothetical protein
MRRAAIGTVAAGAALALLCLVPAPVHPANGLARSGSGPKLSCSW